MIFSPSNWLPDGAGKLEVNDEKEEAHTITEQLIIAAVLEIKLMV